MSRIDICRFLSVDQSKVTMMHFIAREHEMARLNELRAKRSSSLVIIKGRRRIGKSRLLREFAKQFSRLIFLVVYRLSHKPRRKLSAKNLQVNSNACLVCLVLL